MCCSGPLAIRNSPPLEGRAVVSCGQRPSLLALLANSSPNCTLLQTELPGRPQELRTLEAGIPLNLYNNLLHTNRTDRFVDWAILFFSEVLIICRLAASPGNPRHETSHACCAFSRRRDRRSSSEVREAVSITPGESQHPKPGKC